MVLCLVAGAEKMPVQLFLYYAQPAIGWSAIKRIETMPQTDNIGNVNFSKYRTLRHLIFGLTLYF